MPFLVPLGGGGGVEGQHKALTSVTNNPYWGWREEENPFLEQHKFPEYKYTLSKESQKLRETASWVCDL